MPVHYELPDIPLRTHILGLPTRRQAFRDDYGQCLNCGHSNHSVRTCPDPSANTSAILNPELRTVENGEMLARKSGCVRIIRKASGVVVTVTNKFDGTTIMVRRNRMLATTVRHKANMVSFPLPHRTARHNNTKVSQPLPPLRRPALIKILHIIHRKRQLCMPVASTTTRRKTTRDL